MQKTKMCILVIGMIITRQVNAQISHLSNTGGAAGNYVGWDNSNNFPLQFRHENNSANSRFEWYTNIGGTTDERMRLTQTGFLGLGTNAPSSFFHLNTTTTGSLFRTDGLSTNLNQWQLFTGTTEKFRLYIPANSSNVVLSTRNNGNMFIETGGNPRVRINNNLSTPIGTNYTTGHSRAGYMLLSTEPTASMMTTDAIGAWSLLHLNSITTSNTNFYRNWMRTGITFTGNGDAGYIGYRFLPNPALSNTDRSEMTIAWSNDGVNPYGPDDMVFRFLGYLDPLYADSILSDSSAVNDLDGRNIARFTPTGRFAIGPMFGYQQDNSYVAPTERIDAQGNARLRELPTLPYMADSAVTKVVMVDSNGVLRWKDVGAGGTFLLNANNGLSVNPSGTVVLGQNVGQVANPAILLSHREIPMNGFNLNFTQNGRIGIGDIFSIVGTTPLARMDIRPSTVDEKGLLVGANSNFSAIPFYEMNTIYDYVTGTTENTGLGIYMGGDPTKRSTGLKIESIAASGTSKGIEVTVLGNGAPDQSNTGGNFQAHGVNQGNTGVVGGASGSTIANTAGQFRAGNPTTEGQNGVENIGVYAYSISGQNSIGIMASATGGTVNNYAAHFSGDVFINGVVEYTSDINLKENVEQLGNVNSILNQLNPVQFEYKQSGVYERMNMPENLQYGMIAQEVELVLPSLINEGYFPAERDSLGNVIAEEITFKTMNYEALIPILVKGHQEQSAEIEVKDSVITILDSLVSSQQATIADLNDRLTQLENCLSGILPFLCQLSQQSIQENTTASQEKIRSQLAVRLNNKEAIVLDQNVPNPFAEQTVINFSIPATVAKAQIHFYTAEGKLMQSVDVKDRGLGSITVFGSDLSSGTYTYSLVADEIVVATKRMVKE